MLEVEKIIFFKNRENYFIKNYHKDKKLEIEHQIKKNLEKIDNYSLNLDELVYNLDKKLKEKEKNKLSLSSKKNNWKDDLYIIKNKIAKYNISIETLDKNFSKQEITYKKIIDEKYYLLPDMNKYEAEFKKIEENSENLNSKIKIIKSKINKNLMIQNNFKEKIKEIDKSINNSINKVLYIDLGLKLNNLSINLKDIKNNKESNMSKLNEIKEKIQNKKLLIKNLNSQLDRTNLEVNELSFKKSEILVNLNNEKKFQTDIKNSINIKINKINYFEDLISLLNPEIRNSLSEKENYNLLYKKLMSINNNLIYKFIN